MIPRAYTIPQEYQPDIRLFPTHKGTCKVCGKEFTGPKNKRHCSRKCRDSKLRKTLKERTIECLLTER